MSNTTPTYWDVDGQSLNTWAWNITTLGGGRDTVPAFRGSDRQYAYKDGAQARPQVTDSRTITLAMTVLGMQEDGTVPPDMEAAYNENRRMLKRLFWRPRGALFPLTKRWKESTGIITATAMGRVASNMEPEMMGPRGSKFVVDVFLPDPWFYGPAVEDTLALNVAKTITNHGDGECTAIEVDLVGQLGAPKITNQTFTPDVWMKVGSAIAAGDTVTADVDAATVTRTSDGANLIGALTHSGARPWLVLGRDTNTVLLTADSGTGNAVIRHRPSYF